MMATSRRLLRSITSDALTAYLVALRHTQVPTPEEERALGRRIQAGDEAAVHALVERHLRFVVHVAKRYKGYYGLPLADLINEGNLGLLHAARKFDPERGVRFITYAVWWIRQAILHALAEGSGAVRLPLEQAKALVRLRQQVEAMRQQAGRDPAPEEVATALGMPAEEVQDLLRAARPSLSLDAPLTDDSEATPLDVMRTGSVPSSEDTFFQASMVREVHRLLEHLDPREARILRARFGIDGPAQNLEAIGRELGLSAERVRQLETRAYKKLRRQARQKALQNSHN
jgi:RNA polymerase primary sigma factor